MLDSEEDDEDSEAKEKLLELLGGGRVSAQFARDALKRARIPERAWRRQKKKLGVISQHLEWGGPWFWALPERSKAYTSPETSPFGENGVERAAKSAKFPEEERFAEEVHAVPLRDEGGRGRTGPVRPDAGACAELFGRAAALGFPSIELRRGCRLPEGETTWRGFTRCPTAEDFAAAAAALGGTPRTKEGA